MGRVAAAIRRPPLAPCSGPSAGSPSDKSAPFPTRLLTPLLMPMGRNGGNLNFTYMRGARREGRAASDLSGCHKRQTRLKASLQQKKLLGAPLRGDGRPCRAAGSSWKVQLHPSSCAPHRLSCQHRLPGELPWHTGKEHKQRNKSQKKIPEEDVSRRNICRQMSTKLTYQQVHKETFSKPYQRGHLNPLQTERSTQSPKQSLNVELGHPPGSGHAMSTRIWERQKWGF